MHNFLIKLKTLAFMVLALFFSILWVLTLFVHGWAAPFPRLLPQKPLLLSGLAFSGFIFFMVINRASIKLSHVSEKKFVSVVLVLYTFLQIAFVILFPVNAYEDAVIVDRIARDFLKGDFYSLGIGHYLGYYPNNIGITLFFTFLYSFLPDSNMSLRFVNVLATSISAWLIYRIYKELYPEREKKAFGIMLLAVTFVPPVILNNFTYGDIFSNTFCLAAMLNALKFTKQRSGKYAAYTALFIMAGNFMRSVAFLYLAAIIIYWVLNIKPKSGISLRNAAYACLALILYNVPIKVFSFIGVKTGIIPEPVGKHANPVWRWINIGFPGSRLGYWDGGRNICIFVNKFNCSKHDSSIYFINDILSQCKRAGFGSVLKCYAQKTFWLWTEGTYSVNYYGLSQDVKADRFMMYITPLIKYVEPRDYTVRISLDWILHSFNWLVLALVILYLFDAVRHKDFRMELFIYVILIYIGFYLFWEVKSRYIFGVYPIFLIMSYSYSEKIYHYLAGRYRPSQKQPAD